MVFGRLVIRGCIKPPGFAPWQLGQAQHIWLPVQIHSEIEEIFIPPTVNLPVIAAEHDTHGSAGRACIRPPCLPAVERDIRVAAGKRIHPLKGHGTVQDRMLPAQPDQHLRTG